jgi:hypothetical protein
MGERLGNLSSRERELVEAVAAGGVLRCAQLSPAQLASTGNPAHIIRAQVLRDLLVSQRYAPPDPRGICLRGARITGILELSEVQAAVGMELRDCWVDEQMRLRDASVPWLSLSGSRVPALVCDGLRVDGSLILREGFRTTGGRRLGGVRVPGARIGGRLDLSNAQLTGQDWPALIADGLQIGGDLILSSFHATAHSRLGTVRLAGAHIYGQLDLSSAILINQDGAALIADGLQVDGDLIPAGLLY